MHKIWVVGLYLLLPILIFPGCSSSTPASPTPVSPFGVPTVAYLHEAVEQGLVTGQFRGRGVGTDVIATLRRTIDRDVTVEVKAGALLFSSVDDEPHMVTGRLRGSLRQGGAIRQEDRIRLSDDSWHEYVLEAYSLEFEPGDPSQNASYVLGGSPPAEVNAILDAAKGMPGVSSKTVQTAIWAIMDGVNREQLISRGYPPELEAVRAIFEAANLDPTRKRLFDESQMQTAGSYITRGNGYFQMGEYAQSVADYTQAVELQPALDEARYRRGFALAQLLKYDAAVADFTEVIRLNPENPTGYFARGVAYSSMLPPQSDLAVADLTKAIELNPGFLNAYHVRGLVRTANLEFDQAINDFSRAVELDERFLDAYYARGIAYRAKEEFAKAIADFSTVINLNPNFGEAYRARGRSYSATKEAGRAVRDLEKYNAMVPAASDRTEVEELIATLRGVPPAGAAAQAVSLLEAVSVRRLQRSVPAGCLGSADPSHSAAAHPSAGPTAAAAVHSADSAAAHPSAGATSCSTDPAAAPDVYSVDSYLPVSNALLSQCTTFRL